MFKCGDEMKKWWIYQKERFPLSQYVPMIVAFAVSGISYTYRLSYLDSRMTYSLYIQEEIGEGGTGFFNFYQHSPVVIGYLIAIITTLIWFMLLRIADEHKDYEEDKLYRPYRAVPRGLITLKELKYLGILLIVIQVGLTAWWHETAFYALMMAYVWFGLMSVEFGVADWLKKQHTLYLLSHMAMMLFINVYVTSLAWGNVGFSRRLIPYLLVGYAAGLVLEVGRKIRAKEEEENGVDTYTAVWGVKKAVIVWLICVGLSLVVTAVSAAMIGFGQVVLAIFILLYFTALYFSMRFIKVSTKKNAKFFKIFPAVWLLLSYMVLGILSWL